MGSGGYNLVSLEVPEWMNQLLDQDQDLGFPLGKGQGKKGFALIITWSSEAQYILSGKFQKKK